MKPRHPRWVRARALSWTLLVLGWAGSALGQGVVVHGTVEAFVLERNVPYVDASALTAAVRLPYAKVVIVEDPSRVGETASDGTFQIQTGFGDTTAITVRVLLERVSLPAFQVFNEDGPEAVLELSHEAGQAFELTEASGRAFNQEKGEVETAQVTAFYYLGQIADFAAAGSQGWSPPYAIPWVGVYANYPQPAGADCFFIAGYGQGSLYLNKARACTGPEGSVRNGAESSIVFHEYAHHFTQSTIPAIGIKLRTDELLADVMAAYFAGDPVIGKRIYGTEQSRRDISELKLYPVTNPTDAFHDYGRPFSGSLWDLRAALIAQSPQDGAEIANQLYFGLLELYRSAQALPDLTPDIERDLLRIDNDIFNPNPQVFAPPHGDLIESAFAGHNIRVDAKFFRGDSNRDCAVDVSDVAYTLNYLFNGVGDLPCEDAADSNDDGAPDISDPIFLWGYLFLGGADLPEPRGCPGNDPLPRDSLMCWGVACQKQGCP